MRGDIMQDHQDVRRTRREMLQTIVAMPTTLMLVSSISWAPGDTREAFAQAPTLPLTPSCSDADEVTPRQMEGPYFKPRSPERTSLLEPGMTGTNLLLTGSVLSRRCQPLARILLDFWHADDAGHYDNVGYRCRGHQFTDEAGRFRLETIVPGLYPGRTRHIHLKAQARN